MGLLTPLRGWLLAANATEAGQARLALAGATPVSGVGGLATLLAPVESGPWRIESAVADKGQVRIEVDATGSSFDGDTDGDGHSDWQEILAGNPNSRHPPPAPSRVEIGRS